MSTKNVKKYAKNTLFYIPSKIIIGVFGILSITIYSYLFNPNDYGLFSLVLGTVTLITTLTTGWLSNSSLRFYDGYVKEGEKKSLVSTLFVILIFINICVTFLGLMSLNFIKDNQLTQYIGFIIGIFMVLNVSGILNSLLRGAGHIGLHSFILGINPIGRLIFVIVLVKAFNLGITALFWSYICVNLFTIFLSISKLKIFKDISFENNSPEIRKVLLKYGLPLMQSAAIGWILSMSDRYVIAYFMDSAKVGIYSIGYNLIQSSFGLLITTLSLSAFPIMVKTWNREGKKETEELINRITLYGLMVFIPAFFGITILRKPIASFLVQRNYFECYTILPWIALGMLFNGINQFSNKIWQILGKTRIIFYLSLSSAVLNVILNIIFIPIFGYMAAALTTLLSYMVYTIFSLLSLRNQFRFRISVLQIVKTIMSSLVMVVFLWYSKGFVGSIFALVIVIICGMGVYFLSLFVLGGVKKELGLIVGYCHQRFGQRSRKNNCLKE